MLVYERANSRKFTVDARSPSGSLEYVVVGATDEVTVQYAVMLESPLTFGGLTRNRMTADPQGGGLWHCTVEYALVEREQGADGGGEQNGESPPAETPAPPEDSDPLGAEWSWTTTGGTISIKQSLETVFSGSALPGGAADYRGAIGVTRDGVEGCEIYVPKFEWSLTREFSAVTRKYLRVLSELTGTVNQAPFMGWDAQEVLFLGADGQGGNDKRASISFKFAAQKTQTNLAFTTPSSDVSVSASRVAGSQTLTVADSSVVAIGNWTVGPGIPGGAKVTALPDPTHITIDKFADSSGTDITHFYDGNTLIVPVKRGWNYVWCGYGPTTDAGRLIRQPTDVYCERVYDTADFSKLGLGT